MESFPRDWLRGVLEPCLLAHVAEREAYGFELASALDELGVGPVPGGSLYPALKRLEEHGWVATTWREADGGRGRKYYAATAAGRRVLDERRLQWARFTAAVDDVLSAGSQR